jgi:hypothetical protein
MEQSKRRLSRWAGRVAAFLMVLVGVGFCLHTSIDTVVLGKYSKRYFVILCIWFLVLTPLVYWLARYLFSTQRLTLPSGRVLTLSPLVKLVTFVVVGNLVVSTIENAVAKSWDATYPWVFHPYLQTAYKPNQPGLHINRWGFRGEEIDKQKPPKTFRIFFFGASTVACHEVPWEDSYVRIVEKRLRNHYPDRKIEVQNLGTPWHGTEHSAIKLQFFAQDFHPDVVVIYHAMSDLFRGFAPEEFSHGEYRDDYGHYYGPVAGLVRGHGLQLNGLPARAYLGYWMSDILYERVKGVGPDGKGIGGGPQWMFFPKAERTRVDHWRSLEAFQRNLRVFADFAKSRGMKVVIASEPFVYRSDLTEEERSVLVLPILCDEKGKRPDLESMRRGMEAFNSASRRVANEMGVRFLDLEKKIPKSRKYFYDDVHYTFEGNRLVADAFYADFIAGHIVPIGNFVEEPKAVGARESGGTNLDSSRLP